jgi:energy-coupling factor transporter ATP-binding protein EcfA2
VADLTQRSGAVLAVDRLSLSIPAGMFYGTVGPNGAGKTTMLMAVCGLREPTSGSIKIAAHDLRTDREAALAQLGIMMDGLSLPERLTATEIQRSGWGYGAALAARDAAGTAPVLLPLVALLTLGALLQLCWIALTARALRRPPRRASARRPVVPGRGLSLPFATPQVAAVVSRELTTWRRDPARGVDLRSAWLTPLLMVLIIWCSSSSSPTGAGRCPW